MNVLIVQYIIIMIRYWDERAVPIVFTVSWFIIELTLQWSHSATEGNRPCKTFASVHCLSSLSNQIRAVSVILANLTVKSRWGDRCFSLVCDTCILVSSWVQTTFCVLQFWITISGMLTGPSQAVFTLGILVPVANNLGVVIGFLMGLG